MISYDQIDTLFLDAGNTLVSIDFDRLAAALEQRGVPSPAAAICRAEAAARPSVSELFSQGDSSEGLDPFQSLLLGIFSKLEDMPDGNRAAQLAAELGPVLLSPGRSDLLWCAVMPGVPEALRSFRESGLQLVVVSNSDGTVEQNLKDRGLDDYFSHVVNSKVIGIEKPDPGIFEYALEISGACKESTVHIGDMYFADVEGARRAGLAAILLDPFDDWHEVDCPKIPDLITLARAIGDAKA
jgi:HAD superfamily hydrolase (TIGR01509 family)